MPVKILFLSHNFYPFVGGIETNSDILSLAFAGAGYEIRLATWTTETVATKTFPFTVFRNPGVKELLLLHKWADVIFENNPCLRLSWSNLIFNRPNIVVLNTWIARTDGKKAIQDKLKFLWLKKATRVIAVSQAVKKHSWLPAQVIGNPYKNTQFRKISKIDKHLDFVFLGRLVSDKGADLAIRALQSLHLRKAGKRNHYTLTIIGDGPERYNLETMATETGLGKFITFTGTLTGEELVECLNRHRFILVPSRWAEPFGNVALEGMACGCVPIVSDGGGLPEAIGKSGITYKRGDMESLISTLENLLHNPLLEQQLREMANEHLKIHSSEEVSKKYLQVIDELTN